MLLSCLGLGAFVMFRVRGSGAFVMFRVRGSGAFVMFRVMCFCHV